MLIYQSIKTLKDPLISSEIATLLVVRAKSVKQAFFGAALSCFSQARDILKHEFE